MQTKFLESARYRAKRTLARISGKAPSRAERAAARVVVDRGTLLSYASSAPRRQLYLAGIRQAGGEATDNFPKQCRFDTLQQVLVGALGRASDGDVAECGCWMGHSTHMIARIMADDGAPGGRRPRTLHVFDSFEGGLSDKTQEDRLEGQDVKPGYDAWEKAHFASTEAQLWKAVEGFDFVEAYKGWIPDRFGEVADRQFAFVHIDVDLYQPTLDSLQFFYPRLSSGGAIVVDDYGYVQFPGATRAVEELLAEHEPSLFHVGHLGGCFLIK